jgi:hypothetical protein
VLKLKRVQLGKALRLLGIPRRLLGFKALCFLLRGDPLELRDFAVCRLKAGREVQAIGRLRHFHEVLTERVARLDDL